MIAEAIDTAVTLGWAFVVWFLLCAMAATAALYTVVACAWWVGRAMWRTVRALRTRARGCAPAGAPQAPSRDSSATGAPERATEARTRPRPSWATEQPIHHHDIEEAA